MRALRVSRVPKSALRSINDVQMIQRIRNKLRGVGPLSASLAVVLLSPWTLPILMCAEEIVITRLTARHALSLSHQVMSSEYRRRQRSWERDDRERDRDRYPRVGRGGRSRHDEGRRRSSRSHSPRDRERHRGSGKLLGSN